jgi:hypothetical protein
MIDIFYTILLGLTIIIAIGAFFSFIHWISNLNINEKVAVWVFGTITVLLGSFLVGFATRFIFEI